MKTIIISILLLSSIVCNSQTNDSLIIKKDTLWNCIENSGDLFSILYEIENRSSVIHYLWIEKDIYSSEREKIRDYFMRNKGDMSIYQMAMETNIVHQCSSIYGTFLKKINPQEKFTLQIFSMGKISEYKKIQIFKYLDEHVVIVSENKLQLHIKGLSNFNPQIFYNKDFVTLPIRLFDF